MKIFFVSIVTVFSVQTFAFWDSAIETMAKDLDAINQGEALLEQEGKFTIYSTVAQTQACGNDKSNYYIKSRNTNVELESFADIIEKYVTPYNASRCNKDTDPNRAAVMAEAGVTSTSRLDPEKIRALQVKLMEGDDSCQALAIQASLKQMVDRRRVFLFEGTRGTLNNKMPKERIVPETFPPTKSCRVLDQKEYAAWVANQRSTRAGAPATGGAQRPGGQ